jgi:cytochrome c biogenesis protein CcdA
MQIKSVKEPLPLRKALFFFLGLSILYALLAFGISAWLYDEHWQEVGVIRWLNLLLLPALGTFFLSRSSRKARLYLTHLTYTDLICRRLTQVMRGQGYLLSESRPQRLTFRPRFAPAYLLGIGCVCLEYRKNCVLLSGPLSKIHWIEKMAHEGEIFLPDPR